MASMAPRICLTPANFSPARAEVLSNGGIMAHVMSWGTEAADRGAGRSCSSGAGLVRTWVDRNMMEFNEFSYNSKLPVVCHYVTVTW